MVLVLRVYACVCVCDCKCVRVCVCLCDSICDRTRGVKTDRQVLDCWFFVQALLYSLMEKAVLASGGSSLTTVLLLARW